MKHVSINELLKKMIYFIRSQLLFLFHYQPCVLKANLLFGHKIYQDLISIYILNFVCGFIRNIAFSDLCSCCPTDFSCVSNNGTLLCYQVQDLPSKIRDIKDVCASDGYSLLRLDSKEKFTFLSTG